MNDIPEDVMQSARELHIALFDHCRDTPIVRMNLEDIARALMAERERAAGIVLDWQKQLVRGQRIDWHAEAVAEAIRGK